MLKLILNTSSWDARHGIVLSIGEKELHSARAFEKVAWSSVTEISANPFSIAIPNFQSLIYSPVQPFLGTGATADKRHSMNQTELLV